MSGLVEIIQERLDPPTLLLFVAVGALALLIDFRLVLGLGLKREARCVRAVGWTYIVGAILAWIVLTVVSPNRV